MSGGKTASTIFHNGNYSVKFQGPVGEVDDRYIQLDTSAKRLL